LRFASEDRAEIEEVLAALAAESRKEPGCVTYVPHQLQDDRDTVLIFEQYRDSQALDAHRASPHFQKYAVGGLYQKMKDRQVENLIAVV
jgi:quinol monooxygenase YgiN